MPSLIPLRQYRQLHPMHGFFAELLDFLRTHVHRACLRAEVFPQSWFWGLLGRVLSAVEACICSVLMEVCRFLTAGMLKVNWAACRAADTEIIGKTFARLKLAAVCRADIRFAPQAASPRTLTVKINTRKASNPSPDKLTKLHARPTHLPPLPSSWKPK